MLAYTLLYPSANIVQQSYALKKSHSEKSLDWPQAGRFMLYGGLFHSVLSHTWMFAATKWIPGADPKALALKVIADQIIFAPAALSSFYIGLTALEFKSTDEIYHEWRTKMPKTWAVSRTKNTVKPA